MKRTPIAQLLAAWIVIGLSGCSGQSTPPPDQGPSPTETETRGFQVQPGQIPTAGVTPQASMGVGTPAASPAGGDAKSLQDIRLAILKYWKDKQAFPPSLQSLTPNYLSIVPKAASGQDFVYDPSTGAVREPPEPIPQPGMQPGRHPYHRDREDEEEEP